MPNAIGFATQGLRQRVGGQVVRGTASETAPLLGTAETGGGGALATGGGITAGAVAGGVAVGVGSAVWNNQHSKNVNSARNFGSGNSHTNTITKLGADAHAKDLALAKAYDKQHKAKMDALALAKKRSFTMGTQMNNRMKNMNAGHGPINPMKTDDIPAFQGPKQPKTWIKPKSQKQIIQDQNQINVLNSINSHNQKLGEYYGKMADLKNKYDKDGNATKDDMLSYYQDLVALKNDANKNAQDFYHKPHPKFTEANYGKGWKSVKQQYDGQVNIFQHEDGNFQSAIDKEVAIYKNRLASLKFGLVNEPVDISEHIANLRVIRLINRESPVLAGTSQKDLLTNNKAQDLKVYKMIKGLNMKLLTDKKKQAEMKAFRDEAVKNKAQFSNYTEPIEILFSGDRVVGGGGFLDKQAFGRNSYDDKMKQLQTFISEYNEKYAIKLKPKTLHEDRFNYEELIEKDPKLNHEFKPNSDNDYITNQLLHMGVKSLSLGMGAYLGYKGITDLSEYQPINTERIVERINLIEDQIKDNKRWISFHQDISQSSAEKIRAERELGEYPDNPTQEQLKLIYGIDKQADVMQSRKRLFMKEETEYLAKGGTEPFLEPLIARDIGREGLSLEESINEKIHEDIIKRNEQNNQLEGFKDKLILKMRKGQEFIAPHEIKALGRSVIAGLNTNYIFKNFVSPLIDVVRPATRGTIGEDQSVKAEEVKYEREPIISNKEIDRAKPRNTYRDIRFTLPPSKPHRQFKHQPKQKLTFDEIIYITEGKKGLDKCRDRGYYITSNPFSWNEHQEGANDPKFKTKIKSYCKDKLNFNKEVNNYKSFKPLS